MSGIESFSGSESVNQGGSAEAYERFKERMAAAAAQIKAAQAQEQKQKQTEDHLAKILSDFLKSGQSAQLISFISALLAKNIPAGFIISLILISNPTLQVATGIQLLSGQSDTSHTPFTQNLSLTPTNQILPLEMKLAIDRWVMEILKSAELSKEKLLPNVLNQQRELHPELTDLPAYSLMEFMNANSVEYSTEEVNNFCQFFIKNALRQVSSSSQSKLN